MTSHLSHHVPAPLVRVDEREGESRHSAPGRRLHLLYQIRQLSEGCIHPCVYLTASVGCMRTGIDILRLIKCGLWLVRGRYLKFFTLAREADSCEGRLG